MFVKPEEREFDRLIHGENSLDINRTAFSLKTKIVKKHNHVLLMGLGESFNQHTFMFPNTDIAMETDS